MKSKEQAILDKIMATPMWKKIEAEESLKTQRAEWARELAELNASRGKVIGRANEALKIAEDEWKAAQDALREATRKRADAQNKAFNVSNMHDALVRSLEAYLMDTAPETLAEELRDHLQKVEILRSKSIDSETFPDLPSAIGVSKETIARMRSRPTSYEERLKELEAVHAEIEHVKERILRGE
jgi:hypothetical protein